MAIQARRGLKADLDVNKLLDGESAVPTDTKEIFIAFAPGDVKRMATYEDMKTDIANANSEIITEFTKGANAAANVVEGLIDGVNTMMDATTSISYTVKIDNGILYLEETLPDTDPPTSSVILADIESLKSGKIDKTSITQTDVTNDATKIPSSAVTHAHGLAIAAQNNNLANKILVETFATTSTVPANGTFKAGYGNALMVKSGYTIVSVVAFAGNPDNVDIIINPNILISGTGSVIYYRITSSWAADLTIALSFKITYVKQ